jgi:hypothetical protein
MAGALGAHHPLGDLPDPCDIGDARSAVLLNDYRHV